jgi:ABC-2 type transport system ATP-binding protein
MTGPPIIAIDGLRKEFGPVTALEGVDIVLDDPEILGLAGPNGSGKTTLIQSLLGLVGPTAGNVSVRGTAPDAFSAADRGRMGYMPQHTAVYDDLTVRENVEFFANLYDVPNRGTAINEALDFVDLAHRADTRVDELSGGMIRRTSLACAIVHDPEILILDEPTVGLDPQLRATMWDGFRKRRDDGSLVIVSTHYLDEARHCDRVLFLREGRVLTVDTPQGFLDATGTDDMEDGFLTLLDGSADTVGPTRSACRTSAGSDE